MAAKKTAKKQSAKKGNGKATKGKEKPVQGVLALPPDDLAKRVARAREYLAAIRAELPELVRYYLAERKASIGRLRDGEPKAMRAIFATIDRYPNAFESLAASDNGEDDTVVETQPSRDDLARREMMQPVLDDLVLLRSDVSDTILELGSRPRQFSIAAYQIADALSTHDKAMARAIAPAKRFYASRAAAKAKTERAAKAPKGGTASKAMAAE